MAKLLELVKSGRTKPSFVVSSEASTDDAPEAYGYCRREGNRILIAYHMSRRLMKRSASCELWTMKLMGKYSLIYQSAECEHIGDP